MFNGWIQTLESLEAEAKAHQQAAEKITKILPVSKDFVTVADRDIKPVSHAKRYINALFEGI